MLTSNRTIATFFFASTLSAIGLVFAGTSLSIKASTEPDATGLSNLGMDGAFWDAVQFAVSYPTRTVLFVALLALVIAIAIERRYRQDTYRGKVISGISRFLSALMGDLEKRGVRYSWYLAEALLALTTFAALTIAFWLFFWAKYFWHHPIF